MTSFSDLLTAAAHAFTAGNLAEAEIQGQRALEHDPRHPEALHLAGLIAAGRGDSRRGIALIRQAIGIAPTRAEFHYNLAGLHAGRGEDAEAEAAYWRAIQLNPRFTNAYINLGNMFRRAGRLSEAVATHKKAVDIDPTSPLAHFNLASSFAANGDRLGAIHFYQHAVKLDPRFFQAYLGLGNALMDVGESGPAIASYRSAVALRPNSAEALANLGAALDDVGDRAEALGCFERALAIDPDCARARMGLGLDQLASGDLDHGWDNYEARLSPTIERPLSPHRQFAAPRWQGEPLAGKTILVWREEGIGDEILFSSCIPDVAGQAAKCIVECSSRLAPLFARSFPACDVRPENVAQVPSEPIDYHSPMGSLPRFLRRCFSDFPRAPGYLRAEARRVRFWRDRLAPLGAGAKVGVLWRSMVRTRYRNHFYTRLDAWGQIFAVPGVVWVNLQYGWEKEEIEAAEKLHGIRLHNFDDLDLVRNVDEVAALIGALDAVIAPSASYGALAGALGKPTLVFVTDRVWDWLGQPEHPFFPSFRSFKKAWDADWPPVLARIAETLRTRVVQVPSPG